jgi:hypothetical protein
MLNIIVLAGAMAGMAMPDALSTDNAACKITPAREQAMMAADYDTFDQSMSGDLNWRAVMNVGCYETAATLIQNYLDKNRSRLDGEKVRTLYFHAGQALALGGQDAKSAPFFGNARGGADAEWNTYVEATLAFVQHEMKKFEAARKKYAEIAPDSPRRGFLDSLSACFTKPYKEAISCPAAPASN